MCKSAAEGGRRCPSSSHYVSTAEKRSRNALQKRAKRVEARRAAAVARTGANLKAIENVMFDFTRENRDWQTNPQFKQVVRDVLVLTELPVKGAATQPNLGDRTQREQAATAWMPSDAVDAKALSDVRMRAFGLRHFGLRHDDTRLAATGKARDGLVRTSQRYADCLRNGDIASLDSGADPAVPKNLHRRIVEQARKDLGISPYHALAAIASARDASREDARTAREALKQAAVDPASVTEKDVGMAAGDAADAYKYAAKSRDLERRMELARVAGERIDRDTNALTSRGIPEAAAKALAREAFISGEPIKPASLARDWKGVAEFPAELKASMFGIPIAVFTE